MDVIFIKGYNQIEGFDFWHKYAIITKIPKLKKNFWDTYPKIPDPNEFLKEGKLIKIKNKKYIIRLMIIDFYISNNTNIPPVEKVVKVHVDFKINKRIFFTLKGYHDFLKEKVQALNSYNYHKYTFQPQENEITDLRFFPSVVIPGHASILSDRTDALKITNPPIEIHNYEDKPLFEKDKIVKNFTGLSRLEPTNEYVKKLAVPLFLNPTYILLEYSPYFKNENDQLIKLKKYFKLLDNKSNLYRNDIIDIINEIDYLICQHERKRSKLDILVDYIEKYKESLYKFETIRKIYGYLVVTRKVKADNGLYIVRKNGQLSNIIYFLKFDSIEFWSFSNGKNAYFEIKNKKNLYYFTSKSKINIKVKSTFLQIKKNSNSYDFYQHNTKPINSIKLKKIDITKVKTYKLIEKFYFIRKRFYHSDKIRFYIDNSIHSLSGTVRPKGEKIIYIIKTD